MISTLDTARYTFEKKECFIRASDDVYAVCHAFTITARNTHQRIREISYLLEHASGCTSFDCVGKNYSSLEDLLKISASEYFFYINFISQNSINDPYYDFVISAEKSDFHSVFNQNVKDR